MRAGRSEPHRAEDAGHEGHVVVHQFPFVDLTQFTEPGDHVQSEDVRLAFLQRAVLFHQCFAHGAFSVHGVLDPQAMGHLMEHRVLEERIERDVGTLLLFHQHPGDGHHDAIELGTHGILELQPSCSLGQLHLLIVGQVHCDGLGARIAITGVVDHVIGPQLCVRAGLLPTVHLGDRQAALQIGKKTGEVFELLRPFLVLDGDVALVGRFDPEQLVLIVLDGTDDDIDRVLLHVQPGHVDLAILIG